MVDEDDFWNNNAAPDSESEEDEDASDGGSVSEFDGGEDRENEINEEDGDVEELFYACMRLAQSWRG